MPGAPRSRVDALKIVDEGGAARCGARDPCPRRSQTLSFEDAGARARRRGRSPHQTALGGRRVVSPMTGDHLFDNVRPWLVRPVDERIAFIRSARWIGTPHARAAHAMLEDLLVRPPVLRPSGLMLLGPYANGKSMIAERFALTDLKATRAEGEVPEGLDRPDPRGRGPAQFLRRHPLGLAGAAETKRAIRWPRPRSSIKSCGACAPVSSSSTSSTIVCAAASATSRRSSPRCGVSGANTTFRRRSSAKPPSTTTSI